MTLLRSLRLIVPLVAIAGCGDSNTNVGTIPDSASHGGALDAFVDDAVVDGVGRDGEADAAEPPDDTEDPHNCGRVGHDCCGGACVGGVCQAAVVTATADGAGFPISLAADDVAVYFAAVDTATGSEASIKKVPIAGGSVTTLATSQVNTRAIAVGEGTVYWAKMGTGGGDGAVMKVSTAGGAPVALAAGEASVASLAIDAVNAYWTSESSPGGPGGYDEGFVKQVPLAGGAITTLATGQVFPNHVAVDATHVYWSGGIGLVDAVMRVPIGGGTPQAVVNPPSEVTGVGLDATRVFWVLGLGPIGHIDTAPRGGGPTTRILDASIDYITSDATDIYFSGGGTGATDSLESVASVPIAGGSPITLATNQERPQWLANNAKCVFWVTWSKSPTIVTVAKP